MASVYARGNKLWYQYKDARGTWVRRPSTYVVGDEEKAEAALKLIDAQMEATRAGVLPAATAPSPAPLAPAARGCPTVAAYSDVWLQRRRKRDITSIRTEEGHLKHYILPALGKLRLDEVRPRHLRDLVLALQDAGKLAPRSIRHIYATARLLFKGAVVDEHLAASPCVLERGVLPKDVDADPTWRATAIYNRDELEALTSDGRIPEDRRVFHALEGIAALRHGEAARLRWRDYEPSVEPLGRLNIGKTKTDVSRAVPVHPTLAAILAAWKLGGWERTFGRSPQLGDFVAPAATMAQRDHKNSLVELHADLATLGVRPRRAHDLRRTFISLAQIDGADRNVLKTVTHGEPKTIMDLYTTYPWATKCEAVGKLRVRLRDDVILAGPPADQGIAQSLAHLGTVAHRRRRRWGEVGGSARESNPPCRPSQEAPSVLKGTRHPTRTAHRRRISRLQARRAG